MIPTVAYDCDGEFDCGLIVAAKSIESDALRRQLRILNERRAIEGATRPLQTLAMIAHDCSGEVNRERGASATTSDY